MTHPIASAIRQIISQSENFTYIFGAFYSDWAVMLVNWRTFPYIAPTIIVILVSLNLILRKRAKHLLPWYRDGIRRVCDGMCNITIGGLGTGWGTLIIGLSPFLFTAPLVIVPIGLYGLVIADVFWLKRTFRKAGEAAILG